VLKNYGIPAACITGDTPKEERARIISEFKAGILWALTTVNVLAVGFDYPDIDLIVMLRPTMSPGLYVQMAGRGMRPKSHTDHCKVLDFAGVVAMHGPITAVQIPDKKGAEGGQAPVKTCPQCEEICHASVRSCPACGWSFPIAEKEPLQLRNDDIMGLETQEMEVTAWRWRVHTSRTSGLEMLTVTYYGDLSEKPVMEYLPVLHEGYAGAKARNELIEIAIRSHAVVNFYRTGLVEKLNIVSSDLNAATPPATIAYKPDGRFFRVISRSWAA
jgi:DNA repair protein RadD